jgi:Pyruvate/2-oxoacid:ferredoxin oxidoreductase delta subunit
MATIPAVVPIRIDHEACTECRMCYVVCREIDINAVVIDPGPLHRFEIDLARCLYPGCTVCLPYCPAPGSIVEVQSGRSLVPPPPELWAADRRCARGVA